MTNMSDLAVNLITCNYCGERPGNRCRAIASGRISYYPHAARTRVGYESWSRGYEAGRNGATHRALVVLGRDLGLPDAAAALATALSDLGVQHGWTP